MIRCQATDDQLRARAENFNRVASAKGPAIAREIAADNRDALLELLLRRAQEAARESLADHYLTEAMFAYERAQDRIDHFVDYATPDTFDWFDLALTAEGYGAFVAAAVQYLDTRGLIERDPEHPTWIAIRDEDEATSPTARAALLHLPLRTAELPAAVAAPLPLPVELYVLGRRDPLSAQGALVSESDLGGDTSAVGGGELAHGESIAKMPVDEMSHDGATA